MGHAAIIRGAGRLVFERERLRSVERHPRFRALHPPLAPDSLTLDERLNEY